MLVVDVTRAHLTEAFTNSKIKRNKEMGLFCPSCSKEVTPEVTRCQSCGYVFGPDTLKLLTSTIKEGMQDYPNERRKQVRVPRNFKVVYSTAKAFVNSYLSNIGTGGLFIRTNDPPNPGEIISLKIFLPDGEKDLEALGEVMWSNKEERVESGRKFPAGIGVKFVNLSTQEKIRISLNILEYHK